MNYKQSFLIFLFLLLLTACTQAGEGKEQVIPEQTAEEPGEDGHDTEDVEDSDMEANEEPMAESNDEESVILDPQYRINPTNYNVEPIQDAPKNVVMLTIDDAPDKHALKMAKILKELNVNAIFFVNGHFLTTDEKKSILKQIHDMGFVIGNHTMTHANLKTISEDDQYKEIVGLNDLVEEIIGERPKFFRAPHGVNTDYSRQIVSDENMVLMNWSYGYDFMGDYMSKEALADIMVNTELLRNGANLLMHDREWTKDALKDIVIGLQNKDYIMVDPKLLETVE